MALCRLYYRLLQTPSQRKGLGQRRPLVRLDPTRSRRFPLSWCCSGIRTPAEAVPASPCTTLVQEPSRSCALETALRYFE